jgi:hypothetical protein
MSEKAGRTAQQSGYQSFLLRLWRVKEGDESWRASLESAQTGDRRSFATLDALFEYIRSRTRAETSQDLQDCGDKERLERR